MADAESCGRLWQVKAKDDTGGAIYVLEKLLPVKEVNFLLRGKEVRETTAVRGAAVIMRPVLTMSSIPYSDSKEICEGKSYDIWCVGCERLRELNLASLLTSSNFCVYIIIYIMIFASLV